MSSSTMTVPCPECGRSATITVHEVLGETGQADQLYTLGCPGWHNSSVETLRTLWADRWH
jgi:hypothetical protein